MKEFKLAALAEGNVRTFERVEDSEMPIFTSDPATFMVAANVLNKVRESVSELKAHLSDAKPELELVIESVLSRMTASGMVKVVNDRILILKRHLHMDLKRADHFDFLPKVMATVANRIHQNFVKTGVCVNDEIGFRSFPDHPKVRRRILEITDRYLAEINQLDREVEADPSLVAEKVRFCMVMTGNLEPEDF